MFARLFSNTVMGIGTFARLGPEPLTFHLRERDMLKGRHTGFI